MENDWDEQGARAFAEARHPKKFIEQHVAPLLYKPTRPADGNTEEFSSEEQFWEKASSIIFASVHLKQFRLSDWFPRTPGVYWSRRGIDARRSTYNSRTTYDRQLGRIFAPQAKMSLIEDGGIGTIRLRPRRIEGSDCWFATAVKGSQCAGGIPLALPQAFLSGGNVTWGDTVNLSGTVRFLQDAALHDVAAYVHHASPVMVFVEKVESAAQSHRSTIPVTITPVALFDQSSNESENQYVQHSGFGYTFVQSGSDARQLDSAADWIERYAEKHGGKVVTNFDECSPVLADAPLSYQRLVARTYDRVIINNFRLEQLAHKIDIATTNEYNNFGEVAAMGDGARSDNNTFKKGRGGRRFKNPK
jgi:hypothetical protein